MATPPFKDDTFLARWLSGELSAAEEQELRSRPDFAAYERMVGKLNQMAPPEFDAADGFQKLKSERAKRRSTGAQQPALHPRPRLIKRMLPWSAAAAVLLLLTAWFFLRTDADQFDETIGRQQSIAELTDGSTARINAGGDFAFVATADERGFNLDGEAYFKVEKSTVPFVVKTSLGEVRVLGTSFNVYSRNDSMAVSCTTGKVNVRFAGDTKDYPITRGQSVSRNREGVVTSIDTTSPEHLDWLSGKSVFINRPLFEALDELERQYDLTIIRPSTLDQQEAYDITFSNVDLDLALDSALGSIKGFEYELQKNTVTLIPAE